MISAVGLSSTNFPCCLVTRLCPVLCVPMGCSTPGFSVLHYPPEFAQIHVHWVGHCHPTISSSAAPFSFWLQSFPASGSFPVSQLFRSGDQSIGASASVSVFPMNIQGWFPLGLTSWSPCSPRDLQESFPVPQLGCIKFSVLSLLYISTLTFIHDHWKNHSFDYMDLCWQSDVQGGTIFNFMASVTIYSSRK